MMRFVIAVLVVLLFFFLCLNVEKFFPGIGEDVSDPIETPDPDPDPIPDPDPEPIPDPDTIPDPDPYPLPDPEPDVLLDEGGRTFSYLPVGDLINGSAPSSILVDPVIYDDQIGFPTEDAVFLNSQVYGHGGGQAALNGKGPDQCDGQNYGYPWQDTFCEKRGRSQYFCNQGGHTGLDIRPASCAKNVHWVNAPEDGTVFRIGSYSVRMMSDDGTWYQFLHMDMDTLPLDRGVVSSTGQRVVKGQRLGKISNVFFNSSGNPVPTTIHLHLDMKEAYSPTDGGEPQIDRVNPYMTMVAAYERKLRAEAE